MFKKSLAVAAAVGMMFVMSVVPAHADSAQVGGELNRGGGLVQYNYVRTHTFTGPISMNINDRPKTELRLGLRDMSRDGNQFTETLEWRADGPQEWGNILQNTRFALQGRMGACSWFCDNIWGGTITY